MNQILYNFGIFFRNLNIVVNTEFIQNIIAAPIVRVQVFSGASLL